MLYTVANTFEIGRSVDRIVDATGKVMAGPGGPYAMECDTETGRVRLRKDGPDGVPLHRCGELLTEVVYGVPPLVVFFKEPAE